MREVLKLDLDKLDLRAAITGTIALAIALVFVGVFGDAGLAAGVAALFVIAAGKGQTRGPDAASFWLIMAGAVITVLVGYSAGSEVAASATLGAITLVATLAACWGHRYSSAGVFAVLWAVLVLTVGATPEDAAIMALAFALGGGIALASMWISSRIPSDDLVPSDEPAPTGEKVARSDASRGDGQISPEPGSSRPDVSRLVTFAILRAVIAGASIYIGYQLFPDHATWMALTFVIVVRPPAHQVIVTGVARTLGTLLGVLLGMLVAGITVGNTTAQLVAFAIVGFAMVAVQKVNYALSTLFMTAFILLSEQFLLAGVISNGWQRLLATLMGVGVGFLLIAVMRVLYRGKTATSTKTAT